MAIAQFSDDARTEFKLNSYNDKERLLDAINKISYKGGNTKTGESGRAAAEDDRHRPNMMSRAAMLPAAGDEELLNGG